MKRLNNAFRKKLQNNKAKSTEDQEKKLAMENYLTSDRKESEKKLAMENNFTLERKNLKKNQIY